jgi:hypothetical protein
MLTKQDISLLPKPLARSNRSIDVFYIAKTQNYLFTFTNPFPHHMCRLFLLEKIKVGLYLSRAAPNTISAEKQPAPLANEESEPNMVVGLKDVNSPFTSSCLSPDSPALTLLNQEGWELVVGSKYQLLFSENGEVSDGLPRVLIDWKRDLLAVR